MADPVGYEPQFDFSNYQSTNPSRPLPGHELDVELLNISNAVGETQAALANIRRSDGKLKNGIVTEESLATGLMDALVDGAISSAAASAAAAEADANRAEAAAVNAALGTPYGFTTVQAFLTDNTMGYEPPYANIVTAGQYFFAGGHRYQVAAAGATDHHVQNAGVVKAYVAPTSGVRTVEAYGASPVASGSVNAAAIKKALETCLTGETVVQESELLVTNALNATVPASRLWVKLNLEYSGTGSGAVVQITGAKNSHIDISVDVDGASLHGLRLENSDKSVVPRTATLKNVNATAQACAGLFTRNSPDMILEPTILSITGNGAHAVRGIWVSDTTLVTNATRISPLVDGVTITTGGAADDADGVFAENSNASHWGGIQIVGGFYSNCQKRFIKVNSERATARDNRGRNDLAVAMYSFVSCYGQNTNMILANDFEKTGAAGVLYQIDVGGQAATDYTRAVIDKNRASSAIVAASSLGIRIGSIAANLVIGENEIIGTEGILQQYGSTGATGQNFIMGAVKFDNLGGTARNGIVLTGDFEKCRVEGVSCKNAVASRYFLTAANAATEVVEIVDVRQAYSFGGWQIAAGRPKSYSDHTRGTLNSYTIIDGKYHYLRNSAPTSGTHEIGDKYWRDTVFAGAGNYIGGVCTTAGTPGTWTSWGGVA